MEKITLVHPYHKVFIKRLEYFLEKLTKIFEKVDEVYKDLKDYPQTNFYPNILVKNVVRLIKVSELEQFLSTNQNSKVDCEKLKQNLIAFIAKAQQLIKEYEAITPLLKRKHPELLNHTLIVRLCNKFYEDFNSLSKQYGFNEDDDKNSK